MPRPPTTSVRAPELIRRHLQRGDVEVGVFPLAPLRHNVDRGHLEGPERSHPVVIGGDEGDSARRLPFENHAVAGGEDDRAARGVDRGARAGVVALLRVDPEDFPVHAGGGLARVEDPEARRGGGRTAVGDSGRGRSEAPSRRASCRRPARSPGSPRRRSEAQVPALRSASPASISRSAVPSSNPSSGNTAKSTKRFAKSDFTASLGGDTDPGAKRRNTGFPMPQIAHERVSQ